MNRLIVLFFLLMSSQPSCLFGAFCIKAGWFFPAFRRKVTRLNFGKSDFVLIDFYFKKNTSTNIAILKNLDDKFILKQVTNDKATSVVIKEKVAADIAESIGIAAHKIIIIPIGRSFEGKKIIDKPATLHSFVPGVIARTFFQDGHGPDIRQYNRSGKQGSQRGLRRVTITDMARHPDLSALVAFDTFIANHDRSPRNYFYDEKKDCYFAIDLASSFSVNIAQYAYDLFSDMVKKNKEEKLSSDEINGLVIYQSILKKLITLYPPEVIYAQMVKAMREANLTSYIENRRFIRKRRRFVQANYDSCKQVVAVLDILLKNHTK